MRIPVANVVVASWFIAMAVSACQGEPKVTITTKVGGQAIFQVEIADTPAKREMGLQYRRELAADRGMIFLFPLESQQSFWMKNTPIPLDMIFISSDQKIVGIIERTVPFSLDALSVTAPSQFVLEIKGGLSRSRNIGVGDAVHFERMPIEAR